MLLGLGEEKLHIIQSESWLKLKDPNNGKYTLLTSLLEDITYALKTKHFRIFWKHMVVVAAETIGGRKSRHRTHKKSHRKSRRGVQIRTLLNVNIIFRSQL